MKAVPILAAAFSLLVALPVTATTAKPGTVVDDATGIAFGTSTEINGIRFRCLGAGVRRFIFLKVYAVTFCMEETIAANIVKANSHRKNLEDDDSFFASLHAAPGNKLVVMRLVRDVPHDKLAGIFRDSLGKHLPDPKVEKLVKAIPGDAISGQTVKLYAIGDKLTIDIEGLTKTVEDREIAEKLWRTWLGSESVTPTLKESIAARIVAG